MFRSFSRAFFIPELRGKILFTFAIMVAFRLGAHIPTPGVNYAGVHSCLAGLNKSGGNQLLSLVNLFSGGALLQITIFALGVTPYITASIVLQLLTVVIPRLEILKKEGQAGQAKITQYTRYLTVLLAVLQASAITATAASGALFGSACPGSTVVPDQGIFTLSTMVITITAGTVVIMWLAELITDRGIGNGMSLLIFTSVIAQVPSQLWSIRASHGFLAFFIVIAVGLIVIGLVVFIEQAQRRIPVQYAKRVIGRRAYGGTSTYIPLKINQAGVIPVIFASSLLYIPALIVQFAGESNSAWGRWINTNLAKSDHPLYIALYCVLILFFAFFYVSISFDTKEVADNMNRFGGFIPGIRAGQATAQYLSYVLTRITWPGAIYLTVIALIPLLALGAFQASANFPFGGTAIIIIVGVGLDTVKQIEAQVHERRYEGFLH